MYREQCIFMKLHVHIYEWWLVVQQDSRYNFTQRMFGAIVDHGAQKKKKKKKSARSTRISLTYHADIIRDVHSITLFIVTF